MRQTRLTKRRNATPPAYLVLATYVTTRGPRLKMAFRAAVPRRGAAASLPRTCASLDAHADATYAASVATANVGAMARI